MAKALCCAMSDVLPRVRGEYREMPGLSLTLPQARRLWGLDPCACEAVLRELVDEHFLRRSSRGMFVRVESDTPVRHPPDGRSSAL